MNELIQFKTDLKGCYETVVQRRRSLKQLETIVHGLVASLDSCASHVIRPKNLYWTALSNAIAGTVEEAKYILEEAVDISKLHPITRLVFSLCIERGFDEDVVEICKRFLFIKSAIIYPGHKLDCNSKLPLLKKFSVVRHQTRSSKMYRALSNIEE